MIFGNYAIASLGHKFWKVMPGKIKNLSTVSIFKSKIKSGTTDHTTSILCKVFVEGLDFIEVCSSP